MKSRQSGRFAYVLLQRRSAFKMPEMLIRAQPRFFPVTLCLCVIRTPARAMTCTSGGNKGTVPEQFNRAATQRLLGDRSVRAIGKLPRIPSFAVAEIESLQIAMNMNLCGSGRASLYSCRIQPYSIRMRRAQLGSPCFTRQRFRPDEGVQGGTWSGKNGK